VLSTQVAGRRALAAEVLGLVAGATEQIAAMITSAGRGSGKVAEHRKKRRQKNNNSKIDFWIFKK
jgi:hypothetical protein